MVSPVDELMSYFQNLPGYQEQLESVRLSRPQPAADPTPDPTHDPFAVDEIMRGTDEQRQELVDRHGFFPHQPANYEQEVATRESLAIPNFDERLAALGQEVQTEKKAGGFLGKLGQVVDIGGKIFDAPAEGLERMIGMAYWNEVPLSDRWEMSRWTYDSIWADIFGGGGGGRHAAIQDYKAGKSWEEIEEENEHWIGNMVAHFALDPLWLVGGVPLVGKLSVPGAKFVGQGINFSKVPVARAIPGIRRIGQPKTEELFEKSAAILTDARTPEMFNTGRVKGGVRRMFELTPGAKVDQAYTGITNVTSALNDPVLWESGRVKEMFQALTNGQLTRRGMMGLEGTTPVKQMRALFSENPDLMRTLDTFESLRPMSDNAFWSDAKHILKTKRNGVDTSIPELMAQGRRLEPDEYNKLGSYRSLKFMQEFSEKGTPALYDVYKLEKKDLLSRAEALSGAMKTALSMVTINTPSFVVTNFVNNATSFITKLDDPAAGLSYTASGFRSWFRRGGFGTRRRQELLTEMGYIDEFRDFAAKDAAFYKELTGHEEITGQGHRVRKVVDMALPFVKMAASTDQGLRFGATNAGMMQAAAAVWKVGDGGVVPAMDDLLKSVPGFESWVDGLKFKGIGEVNSRVAAIEKLHTDEFINSGSMLTPWAKEIAKRRFPEADEHTLGWAARTIEASMPDGPLKELDDWIDNARMLRREGKQDYLSGLTNQIDDWHDELSLTVADKKLADRLPPDPLPAIARDRLVPWQDTAEFSRLQTEYRELYSRVLVSNILPTNRYHLIKQAQTRLGTTMEDYEKAIRRLHEQHLHQAFNAKSYQDFRSQWADLLDARNAKIKADLGQYGTRFMDRFDELFRLERDRLLAGTDERVADFAQAASNVARGQSVVRSLGSDATAVEDAWKLVGLEHVPDYVKPEYPVHGELFASQADDVHEFLEHAKRTIPEEFRKSSTVSEAQKTAMLNYINGETVTTTVQRGPQVTPLNIDDAKLKEAFDADIAGAATPAQQDLIGRYLKWERENKAAIHAGPGGGAETFTTHTGGLRAAMHQRNLVAVHHGRATRDWAALNYSQKRGFDGALALMFPYHFWIGRTARDWMRMTVHRPGQTAAFARFFEAVRDINEDAGLPDRLKGQIRIPIPFLEGKLFDAPGSLYFDPIRLAYPLSTFQSALEDGSPEGIGTTAAGQAFDFAGKLGLGINPFMTLGLGATGALGDRHAYVQRGLASVKALPFGVPGPRVFRSASDWLTGISEDPDPEYLTPEIKAALANGEPLPENVLQEALQGIADIASTDGFDGYRTDRMVANLVGADPQRWSPRDGLEALRYRRGPLWKEAERLAKQEKGLRVLTGWGLMPVAVYPEGEEVQRGLDAMFRMTMEEGDPQKTDEFFKQHPEYQVRRIQLMDREDGEMARELDTSLFFLDIAEVEQRYDQPIEELRENIRRAEELGYLETKEGRRLHKIITNDVSILSSMRQDEISKLEALYPNRSKELSLKASPHERALFELREQFYNIDRDDFKTAEAFYAAREAFIQNLTAESRDPGEWMQMAVKAVTIWNAAAEEMGARPGAAKEIEAKRDEQLRALTASAGPMLSREEFERYLAGGAKPPTANLIEYRKASSEMAEYMAISEAPGLTENQKREYKRAFWQSHSLLEKYYGRDEPEAWNAESAATYGRMDQIWTGYYAIEDDARGARDYLAMHLEELNELRNTVGLYSIELVEWQRLQDGALQRPQVSPTSPMAPATY